jgi:hypothetical protein
VNIGLALPSQVAIAKQLEYRMPLCHALDSCHTAIFQVAGVYRNVQGQAYAESFRAVAKILGIMSPFYMTISCA